MALYDGCEDGVLTVLDCVIGVSDAAGRETEGEGEGEGVDIRWIRFLVSSRKLWEKRREEIQSWYLFFSFFTDLKLRKTPRAVLFSSSIFLVSGSVFFGSIRFSDHSHLFCF